MRYDLHDDPDHPDWTDEEGFAKPATWRLFFLVVAILTAITLATSILGVLVVAVPAVVILVLVTLVVPILLTLHEPSM